jgi:predicted secreted Zn-dependent protease
MERFQGTARYQQATGSFSFSTTYPLLSFNTTAYNYHVFCYFNRNEAWARDTVNKRLLQHEQLHFDIAEYYARKLATAFANYTFNSSTIKQDFNTIYTAIITEYDVVDNTYDYETEHSKNKKQQEAWNKKIAVQLLALTVPTSAP